MTNSAGTIEFLTDTLAPLGQISVRRMFGGAGIYCNGVIFGLLADDVLYLKVDDTTVGDFAAEGMSAFSYGSPTGTRSVASYWRAPNRLFDEPEEFVAWARRSLAANSVPARPARRRAVARR